MAIEIELQNVDKFILATIYCPNGNPNIRYKLDKTDNELFHQTLQDSLNTIDTDIDAQDELEELAVTLCDNLMKAVDSFTPKVHIYACINDV